MAGGGVMVYQAGVLVSHQADVLATHIKRVS